MRVESLKYEIQGKAHYARPENGIRIRYGPGREADNRHVVPYNPYLLLKYDAHINLEVVGGLSSVKYLYKVLSKMNETFDFNSLFSTATKVLTGHA